MTIWYDFTTTRRNRSRNGIANVEWSLGAALLADGGDDVRPFALDVRNGLVEIDPRRDLSEVVYAPQQRTMATLPDPIRPGLRHRVLSTIASALGDQATVVEHAVSTSLGSVRRRRAQATHAIRQCLPPTRSAARLVDRVSADDVVISMGADWSGELARQLARLKASTRCRVVTMVYDLIPLTHTHLAFHADRELFTSYYDEIVSLSDLITCISNQTQQDLRDFMTEHCVSPPPTAVLRLGDGDREPGSRGPVRENFFLVVGTIERRKNLEVLYDALRVIESRGEPVPTIVVAGAAGWGVGDLLRELEVSSTASSRSIILLGQVDGQTLDGLYGRARALLFPSHYEGWGLPLREAAVHGCPVAAGDSPAAREAIGSYAGAVLLSPDDAAPWADYMTSEPTTAEPADFRPWSACADDLLAVIKSELGSRQRPAG